MSECAVLTLSEKLRAGDAQLIDVRDYAEFAGERVAAAKLIPLDELEKRSRELDRTRPIYLMCRTGRRSAQAQQKLKRLGFADVINVMGGLEAWKKANLPVERDENAPWSLERQVRLAAGSLVLLGVLASVFVHPYFVWLAGFVGAGLVFAAVTDTCLMGMLLAKMPWNKKAVSAARGCACGCQVDKKNATVDLQVRQSR